MSGRPQCTLFKNPFKTWEAFTERNRGIRMGFSRITATIGALVRSLGPSGRPPLGLRGPVIQGLGGLQGSPFLSKSVWGAHRALAPPPSIQLRLSPTEGPLPATRRAHSHTCSGTHRTESILTNVGASAHDRQRALSGPGVPGCQHPRQVFCTYGWWWLRP